MGVDTARTSASPGRRWLNNTTLTLIALVAGLGAGAAIKAWGPAALVEAAKAIAPIGTLWLNALRMTLVPLIFALVVTAVGGWGEPGRDGRALARMGALFGGLLVLAAATGMGMMTLLLAVWPTAPGALDFLAGGPPAAHPAIPTMGEQLLALVPVNPVGAAANGEITPLVVFAVVLGLALARMGPDRSRPLSEALKSLGEAMMVIVGWVLVAAPLGVFVLGLGVTLSAGLDAAGVLAQAVVTRAIVGLVGIALCYLIARFGAKVALGVFARAALGPQVVAAGTCSSMATLPALIKAAEEKLLISPAVAGAALPLAVSTFRFGNVVMISSGAIFAAHAAGLHPTLLQIAMAGGVTILANLGVVGLPAAAVLYAAEAPAYQVLGAPLAFLPLVVATAAFHDAIDTVCNVTADLAAAAVVQRLAPVGPAAPEIAPVPAAEPA